MSPPSTTVDSAPPLAEWREEDELAENDDVAKSGPNHQRLSEAGKRYSAALEAMSRQRPGEWDGAIADELAEADAEFQVAGDPFKLALDYFQADLPSRGGRPGTA
jgi:hypothetical protein